MEGAMVVAVCCRGGSERTCPPGVDMAGRSAASLCPSEELWGAGKGLCRPITRLPPPKGHFFFSPRQQGFTLMQETGGGQLAPTINQQPSSSSSLPHPTVPLQTLGALCLWCVNTICIVFKPPLQVSLRQSRPPASRGQPGTFGST